MLKKIISVLIAAAVIIMCFSACGDSDKTGKTFAAAVSEMPEHFDPQIAETAGERMIAVNTFDGLFKPDENGELSPCAAEAYTVSEDGLVYTFKLRGGLTYFVSDSAKKFIEEQEGSLPERVTAEDFVFGITRAVLPETGAPYYSLLSCIKNAEAVHKGEMSPESLGVRATDEKTLVITLERKNPDFLYALSQPVAFPCNREFFELTKGRYGLEKKYTVSNGAFYLSYISEDASVRISKNDEYKGVFEALPASVTFYVNKNSADIAKKLNKGTYDCGFFTASAAEELSKKTKQTSFQNTSLSLIFNMKKDKMQNALLRTGLVSCIDTSVYSEETPAGLVPPYYKIAGKTLDSTGTERLSFNAEAAKSSMKAAFDELKLKNLTVEILCAEEYAKAAKSVVSNWQKSIGVELNGTVTAVKPEELAEKVNNGEFDIIIAPISVDSANAADFLSVFTTGNGFNIFGYSSEEYDRIISELIKNPTADSAVYAQSYLLKNAVVLPLYYESTVFAASRDVGGVYFFSDSANVYFHKGQK